MIFLPRNLSTLAALCDADCPREGLRAIRVLEYDGGLYRVEASDGYRLGVVRGASPEVAPAPAGLLDAPNGCFDYLVPIQSWRSVFKTFAKDGPVGFVGSEREITMGVSDCTARSNPHDGRWPPFDQALPKSPARVLFKADAKLLAGLLHVAAAFADDGQVDLAYWPDGKLGVMARNGGQTFDGLYVCPSPPTAK